MTREVDGPENARDLGGEPAHSRRTTTWRPQRPTALVIDYDPSVRSPLATLLEQAGYSVLEASNGYSGLRMVHQHRPELIVLEPALPEVSGLVMVRELKRNPATRDIPVIVVTAHAARMRESIGRLVEHIMEKPLDESALLEQVRRLRAGAPALV